MKRNKNAQHIGMCASRDTSLDIYNWINLQCKTNAYEDFEWDERWALDQKSELIFHHVSFLFIFICECVERISKSFRYIRILQKKHLNLFLFFFWKSQRHLLDVDVKIKTFTLLYFRQFKTRKWSIWLDVVESHKVAK